MARNEMQGEWYLQQYRASLEWSEADAHDPNSDDFDATNTTFQARTVWQLTRARKTAYNPSGAELNDTGILGPAILQEYKLVNLLGKSFIVTAERHQPENKTNRNLVHLQTLMRYSEWDEVDFAPGTGSSGGSGEWVLGLYQRRREICEVGLDDPNSADFDPTNTEFQTRTHFEVQRSQVVNYAPAAYPVTGTVLGPTFRLNGANASIDGRAFIITEETAVRNDEGSWKFRRSQKLERFSEWDKLNFKP